LAQNYIISLQKIRCGWLVQISGVAMFSDT